MATCRSILLELVALTLLSATAVAHRISYDYQRWADFSRLKTFSFKNASPTDEIPADTTVYDDPFTRTQIDAAIVGQLQARGMVRDDAHPDVYVTARRTFETRDLVWGPYNWWGHADGMGYQYTNYGGPWSESSIIVGTLAIDVLNSRGELLWRGTCETTVHPHARPSERAEHIRRDVVTVFKNFPSTGVDGYYPRLKHR